MLAVIVTCVAWVWFVGSGWWGWCLDQCTDRVWRWLERSADPAVLCLKGAAVVTACWTAVLVAGACAATEIAGIEAAHARDPHAADAASAAAHSMARIMHACAAASWYLAARTASASLACIAGARVFSAVRDGVVRLLCLLPACALYVTLGGVGGYQPRAPGG